MTRVATLSVWLLIALAGSASVADARVQRGTPNADVLVGSHGRDIIDGRAGNDEILGLRGPDVLIGGRGADEISAEGNDHVASGSGADRVLVENPRSSFLVRCGSGRDRLVIDQTGQSGKPRVLARRSLMRRVRGCDRITILTGAPKAPVTPPGGVTAPDPVNAGAATGSVELEATTKIFGITHATGGGGAGLRALRSIGVTHDRLEFSPEQTWAEIDERFALAAREGMRVLPILGTVQRISTIDADAWAEFAAAFAARYGPEGTFWLARPDGYLAPAHIEIFNEPYGAWDYQPVEPWAFARLYVKAVDAARRANPRTRYLLPVQPTVDEDGTSRDWTAELFDAEPQIAARVDGLAVHPYGSWAPGADPRWTYWKTRLLYEEWKRRGAPRPLWLTEVGQCTGYAAENCVSEAEQAHERSEQGRGVEV